MSDAVDDFGDWVDSWSPFAVGSGNIPTDMPAIVHKGEGIVPATFMDSIRSGELALTSGSNEGSGQNIYVSVNVEGSVQAENDLVNSITTAIYTRRSRNIALV